MSLNREMLQVARLSPKLLGEATQLVASFLHGLYRDDGGYANRAGESDLYYTSFAVSGLVALQEKLPVESLNQYLESFTDVESLDLVHRACMARVWTLLPAEGRSPDIRAALLETSETFRTPDGGYNALPGTTQGTLYGCFLSLGLYQDLHCPMPEADRMAECIQSLRTKDGGFANSSDLPMGLTPTSSAAAALLRQLGKPVDLELRDWLLSRFSPEGGFRAAPEAPMPDLLSTATALHALSSLGVDFRRIQEPCLDYIDSLWTARGGFHGTWEDDTLDCEYTFYGLLALGHLSV